MGVAAGLVLLALVVAALLSPRGDPEAEWYERTGYLGPELLLQDIDIISDVDPINQEQQNSMPDATQGVAAPITEDVVANRTEMPLPQPAEQGEVLNNIGVICRMQKQYDAAEAALDEAEALFAAIGDLNRRAQTIGNRGDLRSSQKRANEAAAAYRAAADLFAQDGDGWKGAQVLRALSLLQLRRRQITASILTMYESLATRPRLGPGQWLMKQLFGFAVRLLGGV